MAGQHQAINRLTKVDATRAQRNGESVGMPPGKLAACTPAIRLPWVTQPGTIAPTRPATPPAIAATELIRCQTPSNTGTQWRHTAGRRSKTAAARRAPARRPPPPGASAARSPTGRCRWTDRAPGASHHQRGNGVLQVSTLEATRVTASTSAGTPSQLGASASRAKKGIGGSPSGNPCMTASMPSPPMAMITSSTPAPPSRAPRPSARFVSAAQTRCQ